MKLLEVENLTVQYPGSTNPACKVSFQVESGELLGIAGASGAGKVIAETKGIFNSIADFSPDLNFTSVVFNETFAGIHSLVVKPGISKYSPNVLDTSFK